MQKVINIPNPNPRIPKMPNRLTTVPVKVIEFCPTVTLGTIDGGNDIVEITQMGHIYLSICEGLGSDTLEKLRGRSRSELPSPESEDISRRRDSRKGQQLPVLGLSSLAKTYADEEAATENSKTAAAEATKVEENVAAEAVLAPQTKDNNHQAKGGAAKEAVEKDKDSGHHSSTKDKQTTVNKTFSFS